MNDFIIMLFIAMERPTRTNKRVRVADYQYNDEVGERAAKRIKQEKEKKVVIKLEAANDLGSENKINLEVNPEPQNEEKETPEEQENPRLIAKRSNDDHYQAEDSDSKDDEQLKCELNTREFHKKMMDFVVKQFGLDLNKETKNGTTFLNHMIKSMAGISNVKLFSSICYRYELDLELMDANNRTPLLTAIKGAKPDLALWLLKKGVSPNLPKSNLPLCSVMEAEIDTYKAFQLIDMLLAKGADINEFNLDYGEPIENAMMKAARYHLVDIMKYLVMRKARADLEDSDGCTAIFYALEDQKHNQSKTIKFLTKYMDINKPNKAGSSPLHTAIGFHSSIHAVLALLANGADVNQVEPKTLRTPAMMACAQRNTIDSRHVGFKCLEALLRYTIDLKARDVEGHSLVYYFVQHFKTDHYFSPKETFLAHFKHLMTDDNIAFVIAEAKTVLEQAKKDSSLLGNIFKLCTSTQYFAEFLINHVGFDINTQDYMGNVLLSYPMEEEVFFYLMTKNPNVNIKNRKGQTPLMVLQECNQNLKSTMINALIERSQDVQWVKY